MTARVQIAGIVAMTLLAAAILILIGYTFNAAAAKMTPDGKVPLADAGLFTALLLSFREVIGVVKTALAGLIAPAATTPLTGENP